MKFTEATKFHRKTGRAKWRDLLLFHPATNPNQSATLPFVIPSEAEESAVSASQYQMLRENRFVHREQRDLQLTTTQATGYTKT
jgi:hypothetical protein